MCVMKSTLSSCLDDLEISLHRKIDECRCNVAGFNVVREQGPCLGRSQSLRRLIHRSNGNAGIGVASLPPPEPEHYGEGPHRQQCAGIAANEPDHVAGKPGGLLQNALGNVNVDGESAAGWKRIGALKGDVAAVDGGGGILLARAVSAGKGLRLELSGGGAGQGHKGRSLIDRHLPVIAGHVPVELVVILEESHRVGGPVGDAHRALGVRASGINPEREKLMHRAVGGALGAGALLEPDLLAGLIGDRVHLQKSL